MCFFADLYSFQLFFVVFFLPSFLKGAGERGGMGGRRRMVNGAQFAMELHRNQCRVCEKIQYCIFRWNQRERERDILCLAKPNVSLDITTPASMVECADTICVTSLCSRSDVFRHLQNICARDSKDMNREVLYLRYLHLGQHPTRHACRG